MANTPNNPVLNVIDIRDPVIQRNFQNLISYFNAQNQLLNFQFTEQNLADGQTLTITHNLGFVPKDIIVTKLVGTGPVTFNLSKFTTSTLSLTATKACVIRFYYGTYPVGTFQGNSTDEMTFYPDYSIFQIAGSPVAPTATELGYVSGVKSSIQKQIDALVADGFIVGPGSAVDGQIALFSGTTGKIEKVATGTGWVTVLSGVYTVVGAPVTSVGLSLPNIFNVSGSPVTTTGTLSATLATQSANAVFAGPTTGSAAAPTFRALVPADIPALSYVTSIGFNDASSTPIYTITNSPVTSAGTLTMTLRNQTANTVFAGPSSGSAAQPTFRALVAGDIPALSYVTSVGLLDGSTSPIYNISSSPVTAAGTLTFTLKNQNQNLFFAGPASGAAAQPNFRAIVALDLGTGTANSTTILYGDLVWRTAPSGGGGGGVSSSVGTWTQEVPSGSVNGSNVTFTLAGVPTSASVVTLFQDGALLTQGVDYTIANATITMTTAPAPGQSLWAVYSGTITPAQEVPSGAVNGVNTTFTLVGTPNTNSRLCLFLDGLLLTQGAGKDYTLSTSTITMAVAPNPGQKLYAIYTGNGTWVQETPSGSGTAFTLANVPTSAAAVALYLDGTILYQAGSVIDYTISGASITLAVALAAGQTLWAAYTH